MLLLLLAGWLAGLFWLWGRCGYETTVCTDGAHRRAAAGVEAGRALLSSVGGLQRKADEPACDRTQANLGHVIKRRRRTVSAAPCRPRCTPLGSCMEQKAGRKAAAPPPLDRSTNGAAASSCFVAERRSLYDSGWWWCGVAVSCELGLGKQSGHAGKRRRRAFGEGITTSSRRRSSGGVGECSWPVALPAPRAVRCIHAASPINIDRFERDRAQHPDQPTSH